MTGDRAGLYVHVPFCVSKCPYCDFYSVTDLAAIDAYLDGLFCEARLYLNLFDEYDSLYIGGGTPSCLPAPRLRSLIDSLCSIFCLRTDAEVTLEVNPQDVGPALLEMIPQTPINRISLGVQSFQNERLKQLGRRHTADQSHQALASFLAMGLALGIDLINCLPEPDSLHDHRKDIKQAIAYSPAHLSCYALTLAPDSPFAAMVAKGAISLVDEEVARQTFLETSTRLIQAGYQHYEISNFARDDVFRSGHNQKYWQRQPVLGLGPAAHSFDGQTRFANVADLDQYLTRLASAEKPLCMTEQLTEQQVWMEQIALGLRCDLGVQFKRLVRSSSQRGLWRRLRDQGYLKRVGDNAVATTNGFLIIDAICKQFVALM